MWDTEGRRYIDASSGPVVSNIGHGNERVVRAMAEQARKVAFASRSQFENEPNIQLADLVTSLAGPGLERAFFVSGGSEATEAAIKLARQYAVVRGETSRWKVIAREPGYHGGTLGALAVTGDPEAERVFGALTRPMPKVPAPFSYRLPANHDADSYARHCAAALEDTIRREGPETVLAFIMEPVGGLATGALVAPDHYHRAVREICTRHGVLLIYDEVMSGAGRTGAFLAADHWPDARPDLVTLAKGIAAGYTPMGAVLAPASMVEAVAEAGGFMHGHTYGGAGNARAELDGECPSHGRAAQGTARGAQGQEWHPRRYPGQGAPDGDRDRPRQGDQSPATRGGSGGLPHHRARHRARDRALFPPHRQRQVRRMADGDAPAHRGRRRGRRDRRAHREAR